MEINLIELKAHYWDKLNEIIDDQSLRDEDDTVFWQEIGHQRDAIADLKFMGDNKEGK
jgi:hypothetical protein